MFKNTSPMPSHALADLAIAQRTEGARQTVERREPRTETNWIAMIRLLDGSEIPCNIKDVSPSGARLGVPQDVHLPPTFMLKVLGRDFVCLVKLAWRRGNYAGVQIERVGKLKPAETADTARQDAASEAAGYHSVGARRSRISSF